MDLTRLESICMALPGTQQDIKWGHDLCFLVGEKMYAVTGLEGTFQVSLKVRPEEQSELIERPGIIPAPYLARYHWILVEKAEALSAREWQHYLQQSYQLVFDRLPRKKREEISGA